MCSCIEVVNLKLKDQNTKLALLIAFGGTEVRAYPSIDTEQIQKGRGKARPWAIQPTYCPFCGVKYDG